jgi:hypothetical protein
MRLPLRLFALAGAILIPQRLPAQACVGAPKTANGWAGLRLAIASVKQGLFGAEGGWRTGEMVTARAQIDRVGFDDQTPTRMRVQAGVLVRDASWQFPACFTGSVRYTHLGELDILTVPIGVTVGWEVPLGARATGGAGPGAAAGAASGAKPSLISHIEPRLAYRRSTLKGFHDVSLPFSVVGGSGVSWRRMYGGIDLEWSPSESHTWSFGLRAAVGF